MCGNVLQASRPNGEPFCWNFCRGFCFFIPKTPSICVFLSLFLPSFLLLFFCGIVKEDTDLPVESCHIQPAMISVFISPSVKSRLETVRPALVC